jgi:hypothetical protein
MALETPIWLQGGTYSARLDRSLLDVIFTEGVVDPGGSALLVAQRAAGANDSVDVAAGAAIIAGDDEADQGKYYVRNTAVTNVVFTPAPGSDSRIDLLVLQVNDPTAGGSAGDNATFVVVEGSVAGSPVPPAVPDTAIPLAEVLRTATDTSITDAMITDRRVASVLAVPADVASLGDIGDVDLAGLSDGDIIRYDSASGDWLPEAPVAPIQTVQATTATTVTNATSTFADTGLTATITPSSATSKVLVLVTQPMAAEKNSSTQVASLGYRLLRDSTEIAKPAGGSPDAFMYWEIPADTYVMIRGVQSLAYLDSPATTSATVYKTQFAKGTGDSAYANYPSASSYIQLIEIPA